MAFRSANILSFWLAACTLSSDAIVSSVGTSDALERSGLRVMSQAEIMENMTINAAVDTFMTMHTVKKRYPSLVEIVKNQMGGHGHAGNLRAVHRHGGHGKEPLDYAGLDNAKNMLNDMITTVTKQKDVDGTS